MNCQLISQHIKGSIKELVDQCDEVIHDGEKVLRMIDDSIAESHITQEGFDEVNSIMHGLEGADSVILEKAFDYKLQEKEENEEDASQVTKIYKLKQLDELTMRSVRYQPKIKHTIKRYKN